MNAQNTLNQALRDQQLLVRGADPLDIQQAQADVAAQTDAARISNDGVTPLIVRNSYDNAVPSLKAISQTANQALFNADSVLGIDRVGANDAFERFLSAGNANALTSANAQYADARQAVHDLKTVTDKLGLNGESTASIDQAITQAQTTLQLLDPLTQSVYVVLQNTVSSVALSDATLSSLLSTAQTDHANVTTKLTTLTSLQQSLQSAKDSYQSTLRSLDKAKLALQKLQQGATANDLASAQDKVNAAQAAYDKLKKGADPIDVATEQNNVQSRIAALNDANNKLQDALNALNDYAIKAPFAGTIAKITVKLQDQASPSTAMATLLTQAKIAVVTLNEVDVSKVQNGQRATLTFDAVPNLTIAGTVSSVDSIGTVTQGVVNYTVKVLFTTEDDRIKPGMSVSAAIITDTHTDVLTVPNAAVKQVNGQATVQVLNMTQTAPTVNTPAGSSLSANQGVTSPTPPETRAVEVGLSNDQLTEITSGLVEGDQVVTRTIDPNAVKAPAAGSSASAVRIPGLTGGGGFGGAGGGGRAPTGR